MAYAYSPDTGEIINTDTPAEWMLTTPIAPPSFDPTISGCFFRNGAWEIVVAVPDLVALAKEARAKRDWLVSSTAWRYERYSREVRLGLAPTDRLATLDTYVQALADVPKQAGFPESIDWPIAP